MQHDLQQPLNEPLEAAPLSGPVVDSLGSPDPEDDSNEFSKEEEEETEEDTLASEMDEGETTEKTRHADGQRTTTESPQECGS